MYYITNNIQIKLSVGKIRAVLKRQNTDVLVPIVPLELLKKLQEADNLPEFLENEEIKKFLEQSGNTLLENFCTGTPENVIRNEKLI